VFSRGNDPEAVMVEHPCILHGPPVVVSLLLALALETAELEHEAVSHNVCNLGKEL